MAGRTERMIAQRNFLGSEGEGMIRRGQAFDTSPEAARQYTNNGLAKRMPGPPSKADAAAAMAEDARQKEKGAKPGETKESPKKDASGLEDWPLTAMSEETYLAKYSSVADPSDEVRERLKLAKARIKAGVSQGATG